MRDPVFLLLRPLYGHPAAGRIWELHLQKIMCDLLWSPVQDFPNTWVKRCPAKRGDNIALQPWASCTVYVDDFVIAGRNLSALWSEIGKHVVFSEPEPIGKILGCHFRAERIKTVMHITQNMTEFIEQAIEQYNDIPETVELKPSKTPWLEVESTDEPGLLARHAASLLMKVFYAARCCRPDVMFTIGYLARFVTKWDVCHDRMLHKLYSYLLATKDYTLHSRVDSKDFDSVFLCGFPDADHAGCKETAKSTSGNYLELASDNNDTCANLEWSSKRQGCVSHSTTEAETVGISKILRESALPAEQLWSLLLDRRVLLKLKEDNTATIRIIETGYSSQLRYISKTQRVSIGFVHEACSAEDVLLEYIDTNLQKGDFLTKGLDQLKIKSACLMVGIY